MTFNGDIDDARWVNQGWDIEENEVIEVVGLHDSTYQAVCKRELNKRLRVCKQDGTIVFADETQDSENQRRIHRCRVGDGHQE
jgi:hypothetical protein